MASHLRRGNRRSGRMKWLVLGLCIATTVLFRKSLLLAGIKVALSSVVAGGPGVEWGYEQIRWDGDFLKIVGFQWKQGQRQVRIDSSQIHLEMDWQHAKVLAVVAVEHPHIVLETGAESDALLPFFPALFSHPRLAIRWEMQHGVLQFPSSLPVSRLFFSFAGGDGADQLGVLTLSYEPQVTAKSLLTVSLFAQEGNLGYRFHVFECDCGHIVPLLPFLSSSFHWKDAEGTVAIDGHGALNSRFESVDFQCKVTGNNLKLASGQQRRFGVDKLEAEVSYRPSGEKKQFWEELVAQIDAQGGYWKAMEENGQSIFALEEASLKCMLSSLIDPEIQMEGVVVQGLRKEPFQLSGKGKIQLDGRYWVQTHVVVGSEEHGVDALISLCQAEKDQHVLHVELERADSDYVNGIAKVVMREPLKYHGSSLQGKMFVEFSKSGWNRLTLDEVAAEGIVLDIVDKEMTFSAQTASCSAEIKKLDNGQFWVEQGTLTFHEGEWLQAENPIHVSQVEGELSIVANELQPSMLTAQLGKMQGQIHVHGTQGTHLLDAHWEGDLGSIFKTAPKPLCRIDGALKKGKAGWDWIGECAVGEEVIHWGLQAVGPTSLSEIGTRGASWSLSEAWVRSEKIPITDQTYFSHVSCTLHYDMYRGEIVMKNGQGKWTLADGSSYQVELDHLQLKPQRSVKFDIRILDVAREIGRANGQLTQNASWGWDLELDRNSTHFYGTKLQVGKVVFQHDGTLLFFEMNSLVNIEDLQKQLKFILSSGLFASAQADYRDFEELQLAGQLQTEIRWEDQVFHFKAQSHDLLFQGHRIGDFKLVGKKEGEKWIIDHLQADSLNAKARMDIQGKKFSFSQVEGDWNNLIWKGSGAYMHGHDGFELKGVELKLFDKDSLQYLGSLQSDGIFQKDQWDLHNLHFSLSPECIQRGIDAHLLSADLKSVYYESYLEGKGDLHSSLQHLLFQGSLRNGRYGINQSIYPLENIQIHYENACLQCRFKTLVNEHSLWGTLRVDLHGAPFGTLQLSDEIQLKGIEAVFHSNGTQLYWDRIEGIACGVDVKLHAKKRDPQATVMEGTIRVDGSRLDAFLPKAMHEKFKNLEIGKGYEFRGDLVLDPQKGYRLNGQLSGNQFELLGYQLDQLHAQIEATPEQIQISKLAIADEAGLFELKKIAIHQTPDKKWSFYIPLLQVKNLQPSLMKKVGDRSVAIKPLVIRNLSLSEIHGDLSDVRGWTGEGRLNFTNAFKKGSTLFDTPIQMIKNFGLDPGLLTPVQGEIDLELRGDKFYLVNLKNAFSDGKRSQFFLSRADQTSYIDLHGNIHIDILMRQDVILKLTEGFTLIVRGTLDKPRYGLR